jgi:hypothetical protein
MKTFLNIVVVFTAIILIACEPEADMFRTFVMKKGEHYSTPRLVQSLQSNTLLFEARFNESAIYKFSEEGFQDSKNKLLGFADCNSQHHDNSARFGWQWFNEQLEIYAYCYVNGERKEAFVGVVDLNEVNRYRISIKDDAYIFQLNDNEPITIERGSTCNTGVYYLLWPYFGGQLPAPHDVSIDLNIKF